MAYPDTSKRTDEAGLISHLQGVGIREHDTIKVERPFGHLTASPEGRRSVRAVVVASCLAGEAATAWSSKDKMVIRYGKRARKAVRGCVRWAAISQTWPHLLALLPQVEGVNSPEWWGLAEEATEGHDAIYLCARVGAGMPLASNLSPIQPP